MFQIELQVRDYECDFQGIVNNANYLHYFEHARHTFLSTMDINFFEITQKEIYLVIYRTEIDYLVPLTYKDIFKVNVEFKRISNLRGTFHQKIMVNDAIYTKGVFFVTALNSKKKPISLDFINLNHV
ncbi:acyl-CoA thioesterase [Legionella beliardensis]|uniref:Acyl-CoA thioesterase n=1 Tax=Legionella beliardensis TaxID=91822 RepID=A0A378JY68_9GAMM|nr:thioesterase family protein [Legionella beliardensis]STX55702.1 acyl-CoA thioesterase [Legionella beliardensis]